VLLGRSGEFSGSRACLEKDAWKPNEVLIMSDRVQSHSANAVGALLLIWLLLKDLCQQLKLLLHAGLAKDELAGQPT
jgi:hypothetical protein